MTEAGFPSPRAVISVACVRNPLDCSDEATTFVWIRIKGMGQSMRAESSEQFLCFFDDFVGTIPDIGGGTAGHRGLSSTLAINDCE